MKQSPPEASGFAAFPDSRLLILPMVAERPTQLPLRTGKTIRILRIKYQKVSYLSEPFPDLQLCSQNLLKEKTTCAAKPALLT